MNPPRRAFGPAGIPVSPLTLGGNVFGWSADEDASFAVLDAYVEAGGNAIDSANVYSAWVPGNRGGESEVILGRWLAGRDDRDDLVVISKVGMAGGDMPKGLTRDKVLRGAEGSLERLGVDRIDLYYAHEDDAGTPLEETMRAFDELVRQGVVGAVAASNYPAERLRDALEVSAREGLVAFTGLQPPFNLVDRGGYDDAAREVVRENGLGVATYYSLARGFLTGKYRRDGEVPEGARTPGVRRDYLNERGFAALDALLDVAGTHGSTPAQTALAWIMAQPTVTSAVASATSPEQVRELAAAMTLELSRDEITTLDAAA